MCSKHMLHNGIHLHVEIDMAMTHAGNTSKIQQLFMLYKMVSDGISSPLCTNAGIPSGPLSILM